MVGKQTFLKAFRVLGVTGVALGVWVLAERLLAIAAVTSEAVSLVARTRPEARGPIEFENERPHSSGESFGVATENLANAQTIGFKRRRAEIGGANHAVNHPLDMTQGGLDNTGSPLDVAIQGEGLFQIRFDPALGDGSAYSRMGNLLRNANGDLIVNLGQGYPLVPAINIPRGATNVAIAQDGTVTYCPMNTNKVATAGQIVLTRFVAPEALATVAGVYTETPGSGPGVQSSPGEAGCGLLQQGYLESSNVDPVRENAILLRTKHAW